MSIITTELYSPNRNIHDMKVKDPKTTIKQNVETAWSITKRSLGILTGIGMIEHQVEVMAAVNGMSMQDAAILANKYNFVEWIHSQDSLQGYIKAPDQAPLFYPSSGDPQKLDQQLQNILHSLDLNDKSSFRVRCKPLTGTRSRNQQVITNTTDLEKYLGKVREPTIIQEDIGPLRMGRYVAFHDNEGKLWRFADYGGVTIYGDEQQHTISQLIDRLQLSEEGKKLAKQANASNLEEIPEPGEQRLLLDEKSTAYPPNDEEMEELDKAILPLIQQIKMRFGNDTRLFCFDVGQLLNEKGERRKDKRIALFEYQLPFGIKWWHRTAKDGFEGFRRFRKMVEDQTGKQWIAHTEPNINTATQIAFRKLEKKYVSDELDTIYRRNLELWNPSNEQYFQDDLEAWMQTIRDGNDSSAGLKKLRGQLDKPPTVSIVIPAHNEERYILQVLQSVASQQIDGTIELIIVDNNSDLKDRTADIAARCGAIVIQYSIDENHPDKKLSQIALARQKGLFAARGEYVISSDADTIMPPKWASTMIEPLQSDQNISCVTGSGIHTDRSHNSILFGLDVIGNRSRRLKAAQLNKMKEINPESNVSPTSGANSAFRREDALECAGYDARIYPGEDTNLGIKLLQFGKLRFLSDPNARIITSPRRYRDMKLIHHIKTKLGGSIYFDKSGNPTHFR